MGNGEPSVKFWRTGPKSGGSYLIPRMQAGVPWVADRQGGRCGIPRSDLPTAAAVRQLPVVA